MSAAQETEIPNGDRLKPVIDAAQGALSFEHARADRLDSKARGQMTLAGSWFAVVQAVAAVALRAPSPPDEGTPTGWVVVIATCAVLGGGALFFAMRESAGVWKLRTQPAITQETLEDMTAAAQQDPATFAEDLITEYRHLLGHAQQQNELRADALDRATTWWWLALGFTFAELAAALLSRIFGV